jgi:hypothetical protein
MRVAGNRASSREFGRIAARVARHALTPVHFGRRLAGLDGPRTLVISRSVWYHRPRRLPGFLPADSLVIW